jgi:hypothetical protein
MTAPIATVDDIFKYELVSRGSLMQTEGRRRRWRGEGRSTVQGGGGGEGNGGGWH